MSKEIQDKVYTYKTKHKEGFLQTEIDTLLIDYPDINMDMFNDALMGNTCMVKDGKIVQYHCDIYKAIICGIENRGLTANEWD